MSRRSLLIGSGAALGSLTLTGGAAGARAPRGVDHRGRDGLPIVIGHRGSPAYRPEHTIASYTLAIEMGADYIEPDLEFTKDGELVARHEPDIGATTDVADHPEFASRRTTRTIDGTVFSNTWFTVDFTLDELKTLRAKERLPLVRPHNTALNGLFEVPTFQEVIDLAKANGVGIYPETKHPTFYHSVGFSFDDPLLDTLRRNDLDSADAKVFIQSFEVGNLKRLRDRTKLPLIQLIDSAGAPADFVAAGDARTYDDLVTPRGLAEIATYADGIGPDKGRIVAGNSAGKPLGDPTTLVRDAHRVGLLVHPFTFRPENEFLASDFRVGDSGSTEFGHARGDQPAELDQYYGLGIDGLFADNPDTAVAVRKKTFGPTPARG
ncbi:glycerophosphodiester phosphodiesterase [Baekduia sp.]|uniref:glycerophosphodiester phosphodiesterase n=1 Tax=Baekduia sp. TaxID=2600305 RepID=UPI002D1FB4CB|nr:glycerophosphodiester phosphodiesterase [Baekduia sp.]